MLNTRRKNVRIFKTLINLTDDSFSIYDSDGNIVTIDPSPKNHEFKLGSNDYNIGFVVQDFVQAKHFGIPVGNVITISSTDIGRDNVTISKLIHPVDNREVIFAPTYF